MIRLFVLLEYTQASAKGGKFPCFGVPNVAQLNTGGEFFFPLVKLAKLKERLRRY